ncbi:alpha/beta hydrolase [Brachybacterium endophyticum]|uniref:Alpha/beta hydrolase n=1 Tax=Brachybacterium endophyticum TaxID=2182385 RepID=A0A2U2RK25_9MICO|nr:alpha/beta hydrolase [Brachybacterium endophyticum]PWH06210.1 alpha/beta hydrolase [Brachybacterium endophyticum]
MALHEFSFPSHNGRDEIQAWIQVPVTTPRAIVQIEHGLGEHSRRYQRLSDRLLDAGVVVAADDHAGHGRTAVLSGAWADTGADGRDTVIADEETLRARVTGMFPDLPYLIYGHSWGSMIARAQVTRHPGGVSGLVLGGIAAGWRAIETFDRQALEWAIGEGDGSGSGEEFAHALFEGFLDRYDDVRGPTDWVALDRDVVADHGADPLNGFGTPLSLRFVRDLVDLYDEVEGGAFAELVPDDLPVLILAGDQDPVCGFGEGAYRAANELVDAGTRDVRTRVYTGFRHEVHNEPPIRDEAAQEILEHVARVVG